MKILWLFLFFAVVVNSELVKRTTFSTQGAIGDFTIPYSWELQRYYKGLGFQAHSIVVATPYIGNKPITYSVVGGKIRGGTYSIDLTSRDAMLGKGTLTTRMFMVKKLGAEYVSYGDAESFSGSVSDIFEKVEAVSTGVYADGATYFIGGKITGIGVNCRDYTAEIMKAF